MNGNFVRGFYYDPRDGQWRATCLKLADSMREAEATQAIAEGRPALIAEQYAPWLRADVAQTVESKTP